MEIITRKQAKELGLKRYFTGKPCKRGHVAERRVSSRRCLECAAEYGQRPEVKERIAEYNAEYRANNKEKNAEYMSEYRANNKERIAEYNAEYRANNKERIAEQKAEYMSEYNQRPEVKERIAEYYQANKERIAERKAKYRQRPEIKERIAEYNAEYHKERYANDPDYKAARIVRSNLRRVLLATNTDKSGQAFEIA